MDELKAVDGTGSDLRNKTLHILQECLLSGGIVCITTDSKPVERDTWISAGEFRMNTAKIKRFSDAKDHVLVFRKCSCFAIKRKADEDVPVLRVLHA